MVKRRWFTKCCNIHATILGSVGLGVINDKKGSSRYKILSHRNVIIVEILVTGS